MIPCYSLFLEVEVPDPELNYFIIGQHELDNTEKLMAPPPLGVPTQTGIPVGVEVKEEKDIGTEVITYPVEILSAVRWDYDVASAPPPPTGSSFVSWGETHGCPPNGTIRDEGNILDAYIIHFQDSGMDVYYDLENDRWLWKLLIITDHDNDNFTIIVGDEQGSESPLWNKNFTFTETIPANSWMEITFEVATGTPEWPVIGGMTATPNWTDPSGEFYGCSFAVDFPEIITIEPDCSGSGLNTFVLGASCLDGDIDLLEGWGAAQPNYKWVDVITDSTDIELERGFDIRQGVVGTPIAGVMEANILDPYLAGINTAMVAVGQRVRLRAGTDIVFSGVCNAIRSDYNAIDTPTIYLRAVDALGLLNAQMVSERPQEGYNTRIAEAASKVELPIFQQESTTVLNPTEDPMSALDLLVETQDSEGSVVWLDRFGTMYSTNRYWLTNLDLPVLRNSRFGEVPRFTFTNNPGNPDYEVGIGATTQEVCLSSYKQVADTEQVINGITFYNYVEEEEEGTDENGDPITEKVIVRDTFVYESSNSRRLYGDAGVRLTTYLDPSELPAYADYIFANYDTPKTKVERIEFPLDKWKTFDVPDMVSIDIGDPVIVRIDDPNTSHNLNTATQRVAKIRHSITPIEWLTELELL